MSSMFSFSMAAIRADLLSGSTQSMLRISGCSLFSSSNLSSDIIIDNVRIYSLPSSSFSALRALPTVQSKHRLNNQLQISKISAHTYPGFSYRSRFQFQRNFNTAHWVLPTRIKEKTENRGTEEARIIRTISPGFRDRSTRASLAARSSWRFIIAVAPRITFWQWHNHLVPRSAGSASQLGQDCSPGLGLRIAPSPSAHSPRSPADSAATRTDSSPFPRTCSKVPDNVFTPAGSSIPSPVHLRASRKQLLNPE